MEIAERNYQEYIRRHCFQGEPIVMSNVPRLVPNWTAPICIGRHAFGDQYRATDFVTKGKGKLTITYKPEDGGAEQSFEVFNFKGDGVLWPCTIPMNLSLVLPVPCFNQALIKKMAFIPFYKKYNSEKIRRKVQGYFPGYL